MPSGIHFQNGLKRNSPRNHPTTQQLGIIIGLGRQSLAEGQGCEDAKRIKITVRLALKSRAMPGVFLKEAVYFYLFYILYNL